jgi:hypothetical protein
VIHGSLRRHVLRHFSVLFSKWPHLRDPTQAGHRGPSVGMLAPPPPACSAVDMPLRGTLLVSHTESQASSPLPAGSLRTAHAGRVTPATCRSASARSTWCSAVICCAACRILCGSSTGFLPYSRPVASLCWCRRTRGWRSTRPRCARAQPIQQSSRGSSRNTSRANHSSGANAGFSGAGRGGGVQEKWLGGKMVNANAQHSAANLRHVMQGACACIARACVRVDPTRAPSRRCFPAPKKLTRRCASRAAFGVGGPARRTVHDSRAWCALAPPHWRPASHVRKKAVLSRRED